MAESRHRPKVLGLSRLHRAAMMRLVMHESVLCPFIRAHVAIWPVKFCTITKNTKTILNLRLAGRTGQPFRIVTALR